MKGTRSDLPLPVIIDSIPWVARILTHSDVTHTMALVVLIFCSAVARAQSFVQGNVSMSEGKKKKKSSNFCLLPFLSLKSGDWLFSALPIPFLIGSKCLLFPQIFLTGFTVVLHSLYIFL